MWRRLLWTVAAVVVVAVPHITQGFFDVYWWIRGR